MSKLEFIWATVKGWICPGTSAFEEVMAIILGKINRALSPSAGKIAKVCETISSALAMLDRYAGWCPYQWRDDFDRIRSLVAQIVGMFEDAAISKEELEKAGDLFRIEYAKWFAD